jgi:hypothetical protein
MDAEQQPEDAAALEVEPLAAMAAVPDPVLADLVHAVNHGGDTEISLTLSVSGTVISGMLIANTKFFKLLADSVIAAGAAPGGSPVESFADFMRSGADVPDADAGDGEEAIEVTLYIHLRDAVVWAPGGASLPAQLWRGRLSHVSGWSLGAIRPNR